MNNLRHFCCKKNTVKFFTHTVTPLPSIIFKKFGIYVVSIVMDLFELGRCDIYLNNEYFNLYE